MSAQGFSQLTQGKEKSMMGQKHSQNTFSLPDFIDLLFPLVFLFPWNTYHGAYISKQLRTAAGSDFAKSNKADFYLDISEAFISHTWVLSLKNVIIIFIRHNPLNCSQCKCKFIIKCSLFHFLTESRVSPEQNNVIQRNKRTNFQVLHV